MACHICILLLFADFETSSLAFGIIANSGTVSLNTPCFGSGNYSSKVFGRGFKYYIKSFYCNVTHDVSCEILIQNKNWRIKLWWIYGHSPNLPMFTPTFPLYGIWCIHVLRLYAQVIVSLTLPRSAIIHSYPFMLQLFPSHMSLPEIMHNLCHIETCV